MLLYGCGHHQAAWRMKDSNIEDIGNISYYQHLAQIAEKGLLDIVFLQIIKPHHQAAWRMKDSNIEDIGNISYYQHLAQIAEKVFWISSFCR